MSEQKIYNKQLPKEERIVLGKSIRKQVPRSSHGDWTPAVVCKIYYPSSTVVWWPRLSHSCVDRQS
jgi:hypothetical protein